LSATFGVFQSYYALSPILIELTGVSRQNLLPDPTAFEIPLVPTTITIALDEKGQGCMIRHEGLGGISGKSGAGVLSEAWGLAERRVRELREILEDEE
jgi:exosome complex component RRP43